jgi:hypothetical protein
MSRSGRMVLRALVLTLVPLSSLAQTAGSGFVAGRDIGVESAFVPITVYSETAVEYSDNVFHLEESQREDLRAPGPDEVASGRYDDMESARDVTLGARLGLGLKSPGFSGGKLGASAWIQYNAYMENEARNYPEAKLSLQHSVGKKGRARLEWKYLDGFFKKNYLSGVHDDNDNGNIPEEERVYSPAVYDEHEGVMAYRHDLFHDKGQMVSRVDVEPFAGWRGRFYNARFDNRDQRDFFGGINGSLGLCSRLAIDVTWQYDDVNSPGRDELVLVDETAAGLDINDDGTIKKNAALTTAVDRSCRRHTVTVAPGFQLTDDCSLTAWYQWRGTDYQSDNPYDVDHYRQTAVRQRFGIGLIYELSDAWSARVEFQSTSDEAEEDDEGYREKETVLTVTCRPKSRQFQ